MGGKRVDVAFAGKRVEVWSLAPPARRVARLRPVDERDGVARPALSHDGGLVVVGTACEAVAVYAHRGRRGTDVPVAHSTPKKPAEAASATP